MDPKNDVSLAAEALEGNDEAFGELTKRYLDPVFRFVFRLVGDSDDAEDVTQEAFLKAWKNLKQYNPDRPFGSWLFGIARNAAIDFLRKKKPIAFSALQDEDREKPMQVEDHELLPDEQFERTETTEIVQKAMDRLPPKQRTVLLLHFSDGLTFQEIADQLGEPIDTVKSRGRRGLIEMKKLLSPDRDT